MHITTRAEYDWLMRSPRTDNSTDTKPVLQDLYFSEAAAAAGVTTVAAYQLWSEPREDPVWRDVVPHFRHLSSQELQPFDKAGKAGR